MALERPGRYPGAGGSCVFLSHPEYGLLSSEGFPYYEELLNTIASDNGLLVATLSKILDL